MNILVLLQRLFLPAVLCQAAAAPAAAQVTGSGVPDAPVHRGAIGVGSWNTTVEFKDIVVTSDTGEVLYQSDFAKQGTNGLTVLGGDWSVKDGVLRQSATQTWCRLVVGDTNWANYTVTLRARKTGGQEGFTVYFNCLDAANWSWFSVGGWTNSLASIDQQVNGTVITPCERVPQSVESDVWYDVRVALDGQRIKCYLDSKLVLTATYSNPPPAIKVMANQNGTGPDESAAHARDLGAEASPFPFSKPPLRGAIGVGCWNTLVEFRNIVVTSNDVVLYQGDKHGIGAWQTAGGIWSITNGVLRQSDMQFPCFAITGDTNWANYTLTLQARKIGGDEGFFVAFGWRDMRNGLYMNAGGWGNRLVVTEQRIKGADGHLTETTPLSIETDRWYDIKVVLADDRVSVYLDSNLLHTAIAQVPFSTNAVYLGSLPTPDGHVLKFKAGRQEFRAGLIKDRGGPPGLEIGSLVQVNGHLMPEGGPATPGTAAGMVFQLSPEDVVLIKRPSWWTWQRILIFGGTFLGVLITAAIWIAMISRKNRLLTSAQRELRKANDELELRVKARTADLARANAELEHEQALFRTLLDTASDSIYFKDTESKFVRCSHSACERTGRTHEQIVGKTDFDIFREEHARQAFDDEQEIIRTGQPLVGKLEKEVHPDGRTTWVMTTKMPWRSPDGRVIGTFGISHDITSIKKAEAELEQAQKQLIDASRAAGMAEVATGVLHNVGNVLNSVNVSTCLLIDQLRESKVKSVGRVAALMRDHAADLGDFITNDPQGRRLAPFLWNLFEQLEREHAQALEELASLQTNVGHIKEIVARQQSYATIAGVVTRVPMTDLLEDALRMTECSLTRHDVKLVKEFDECLPEITVDRHKVLQILVNLIRNAKQACEDSQQPEKQVNLRATTGKGRGKISVTDNGVGIPEENLTRIFRQGFTTRKNGHGFGLHSSALAAKEIGGELLVQSDGPGCGATFTLELSLDPKTNRNSARGKPELEVAASR